MRRAAAAVVAALAFAAPASAQTAPDEPAPVVGGGTFNAAAQVEPGVYRDTLLPNENLYYAIELQPGQTLKATFDLDDVDPRTFALSTVDVLRVQLHGPLRDADPDLTGFATTMRMLPIEATSEPAQTLAGSVGTQYFTGPGRWYVSVSAGAKSGARIELPFVLRLEVSGDPVAEPRRPATTTTTPAPARDDEPAAPEEESGGIGGATAAGVGVGALLLGALGGIALARRGPRRA